MEAHPQTAAPHDPDVVPAVTTPAATASCSGLEVADDAEVALSWLEHPPTPEPVIVRGQSETPVGLDDGGLPASQGSLLPHTLPLTTAVLGEEQLLALPPLLVLPVLHYLLLIVEKLCEGEGDQYLR